MQIWVYKNFGFDLKEQRTGRSNVVKVNSNLAYLFAFIEYPVTKAG